MTQSLISTSLYSPCPQLSFHIAPEASLKFSKVLSRRFSLPNPSPPPFSQPADNFLSYVSDKEAPSLSFIALREMEEMTFLLLSLYLCCGLHNLLITQHLSSTEYLTPFPHIFNLSLSTSSYPSASLSLLKQQQHL